MASVLHAGALVAPLCGFLDFFGGGFDAFGMLGLLAREFPRAHFEVLNFEQGRAVGLAARQLFCSDWDCTLPAIRPPKP